jgi:hypothetical protein
MSHSVEKYEDSILQDCSYTEKEHENQGVIAYVDKNVKLFALRAKLSGKE